MSRRGVLAAVVFCLAACSDVLGPGPDVELTVTLSQDIALPGDNVAITIAVHNPGARDVSLGPQCAPLGFRVVDQDGRRVGPMFGWETSFACIEEIDNTVPTGETKAYGFLWSPYSDYGSSSAVPLPAGEYQIFAGFAGEPLRPPFSDRVPIRVETP